MHETLDKKFGHPADFRVSYRFYDPEEGGRNIIPAQGYRSDFWYDNPDYPNPRQLFMIHPEFEDIYGNVIFDNAKSVNRSGTARMWILNPEFRITHSKWIHIGLTGYFMEGPTKVAECIVIEILGLQTNQKSK